MQSRSHYMEQGAAAMWRQRLVCRSRWGTGVAGPCRQPNITTLSLYMTCLDVSSCNTPRLNSGGTIVLTIQLLQLVGCNFWLTSEKREHYSPLIICASVSTSEMWRHNYNMCATTLTFVCARLWTSRKLWRRHSDKMMSRWLPTPTLLTNENSRSQKLHSLCHIASLHCVYKKTKPENF